MWWTMAAQMGLSFLQGNSQYSAAKKQAEAKKAWQKYNNAMARIGDAINQNAVTTNEVLAMEASTIQSTGIKKVGINDLAKTEAFAAAAGVKGRSVNQSMLAIQRNTSLAERDRQRNLKNQFLAFDQQRLQSSLTAELNQDRSFIPEPSKPSAILGLAKAGLSAYSQFKAGSGTSLLSAVGNVPLVNSNAIQGGGVQGFKGLPGAGTRLLV